MIGSFGKERSSVRNRHLSGKCPEAAQLPFQERLRRPGKLREAQLEETAVGEAAPWGLPRLEAHQQLGVVAAPGPATQLATLAMGQRASGLGM